MKRTLLAVALAAVAFAAGWLLGNPAPAGAAPATRWTAAETAYYQALAPALTALAVGSNDPQEAGDYAESVNDAAEAIDALTAPTAMLAVGELARFAAFECNRTVSYFASLAEDDWNGFTAGVFVEMRNHCFLAVRDAQVELSRFAAANGPFPELPTPTPKP